MGFSPAQVDEMTKWEFWACLDGCADQIGLKSNNGGKAMSLDRLQELGIE